MFYVFAFVVTELKTRPFSQEHALSGWSRCFERGGFCPTAASQDAFLTVIVVQQTKVERDAAAQKTGGMQRSTLVVITALVFMFSVEGTHLELRGRST